MMNFKKVYGVFLAFACISLLGGCQTSSKETTTETTTSTAISANVTYDEDDIYTDYTDATELDLNKESGDVSITKAGTYVLSGTLANGAVKITVGKEETVRLVLQNATITSSNQSAIVCTQAKKLIISLPEGTTNTISDGSTYADTSTDAPTGAIFVQDDVTFNGTGSLEVNGNYNDAISSKDTLKIMEGTYVINAVDDGIVGRDFLYVHDGTYTIHVEGDGLKTTYDTDTEKGDMVIEQGTFTITSTNDAIQAEHQLTVYDGTYNITTGGGSVNSSTASNVNQPGGFGMWNQTTTTEDTPSAKGLKAGTQLTVEGGTFTLDTSDDALHSNGDMKIDSGTYTILTGDDGMHADDVLDIDGGSIDIQKSYEGLEGQTIHINGGDIDIISSDDGVNAAGGSDSTDEMHPGKDNFSGGDAWIYIHGGNLHVNAGGDGLDSNGSIQMDGGNIVIFGPEDSGNGALDYDGEFQMIKGTLIAVGNSGMAQNVSSSSTQYAVMVNLTSNQASGSTFYISDEEGTIIAGIAPNKSYNSVIISTSSLTENTTYQIYTGGNGGSVNDAGYIEYGISGGTLVDSVTLSSTVTTVGNTAGMGGPGGGWNDARK